MPLQELKIILKRLYKVCNKTFKKILIALVLSIIVAASTSGIAWLLDPAVKKFLLNKMRFYLVNTLDNNCFLK